MTPSPQLENYFASGGTSGFQARDRANAELAQIQANTAQTGVQTQGLDLENQIKQQTIRDTMAANRAWMGWDGKNPNDLISGVLKNGGSIAAANGLQQKILENQKLKLGNTAEQLAADKGRHDILAGKVQTILQAPPDQQQALYDQYKGQMSGLLDQGEQLPDQFPGTAALAAIKNAHLLESQQNDNALKQQQTATSAAEAGKAGAEAKAAEANAAKTALEQQLTQHKLDLYKTLTQTPQALETRVGQSIDPQKYPDLYSRALNEAKNAPDLEGVNGAISKYAQQASEQERQIATESSPQVLAARRESAVTQARELRAGDNPAVANVAPSNVPQVINSATKLDNDYIKAREAVESMGKLLDLADQGNVAAGANIPMAGVGAVNAINGIKRINSAEIAQYGTAGSLLQKIQGKLQGWTEGQPIPASVRDDIRELHQQLGEQAWRTYTSGLDSLNKRWNANLPTTQAPPNIRKAPAPATGQYKEGDTRTINGVAYQRDKEGKWHPQPKP